MKSIKQKAREHSLEPRANAHCGYDEEDLENSFEAGANYVLEEIEKLIDNQNWCAFPKQSYKELKELIEQLKK